MTAAAAGIFRVGSPVFEGARTFRRVAADGRRPSVGQWQASFDTLLEKAGAGSPWILMLGMPAACAIGRW